MIFIYRNSAFYFKFCYLLLFMIMIMIMFKFMFTFTGHVHAHVNLFLETKTTIDCAAEKKSKLSDSDKYMEKDCFGTNILNPALKSTIS
jgi:hypothetical protein